MKRVPHCFGCDNHQEYDFGFNIADRKTIISHRCEYEDIKRDLYEKDIINSPKWCPLRSQSN